ncbi:MAG: cation transporter [Lachnospiraceae bacterium]|nr:cation transporter [Lachnospiraceae bacterium]
MNTRKKLTKEEIEKKVLRLSFIGSCLLSGSEIIMALILRSYAVMMDGIFDSAELVMMGPFLVLVPLLYKPVNERHPYGYSQVESFFLIIKYSVLLTLMLLLINTNVHVIMSGGNRVNPSMIAVYEILLGAASVFMYFLLAHISRKYESPTVHAELYLWKTDIVGSCGIAVAFLAQYVLGDTVLAAFAPYMDSAVAIVMSVLLLREPISEIVRGFKQMLLFSPPEDVMRRVHEVVNKNLQGLPYRATFIDVIQTGRKTWIEVYLKENLDTSLIDVRHWTKMREYVIEDLKDDFDQIYVEFIPDLSEE